jgi:hypothetical protein
MLQIHIDGIVVDHIFLISPQLLTQALSGAYFCRINNIIINFAEYCFTLERDGKVFRHHFTYDNNVRSIGTGDLGPAEHRTKLDIDSMQVAADSMTNRATADYPKHKLQMGAVSEVDMVRRSGSKHNIKECPFGEKVNDDIDNLMIYDCEQVTGCMLNTCCSSGGNIDDSECDIKGKKVMNYDVCTADRLGGYEEGYVGDTEPSTDTHNGITNDRVIITDRIREMINELESLTSNQNKN